MKDTLGDVPIERRTQLRKAAERLQALDLSARKVGLRDFHPLFGGCIVDLLLRDRFLVGLSEILKSLLDHRRELDFRQLLIELSSCALKLSVHLGNDDCREHVPGFDFASNIDGDRLQVSGDSCVEQRVLPGL